MALSRQGIAERLREVRQSLGFSQAQVASALGMHRPTVSEIEAGRRAVTSEELFRFASLYATSVSTLLEDPVPTEDEIVGALFRRQGLDTPLGRVAIKRAFERCRAECELEKLLKLQPPGAVRPGYRVSAPSSKWDAVQQGEQLAAAERRRLWVGDEPIRHPMDLLQRQGIRIVALDDQDRLEIDGVYFETDELGACVAANLRRADWTGFRAAFTVAHEYAHWLLQDVRAEGFLLGHSEDDGLQEVRANAFAAAFLMPPDGLKSYLRRGGLLQGEQVRHLSPGDLVRAMDHFGVSKLALLFRLQNLELLDAERAKELRELPLNATAVAERLGLELRTQPYVATRLPILAIECWRKTLITTGRAAEFLQMDVADFKKLMADIGEQQETDEGEDLLGAAALAV